MKSLMMILSLVLSTTAFANEGLVFKSEPLNRIVSVFAKHSPELVKNGKIVSGNCGHYASEFSLSKADSQEIMGKYIFNIGLNNFDENNYTALKLTEDEIQKLNQDFYAVQSIFYLKLFIGSMSPYQTDKNGIIRNHVYHANILAFHDIETNEYLMASGDSWQTDCE